MKKCLYIIIGVLMAIASRAASYTSVTIDNIEYRLYEETKEAHVYHNSYNSLTVTDNKLELPEKVTNDGIEYIVTEIEYFRCTNTTLTLVVPKTVKIVDNVKSGVKTLVLGAGVTSVSGLHESSDLEDFKVAEGNESFCVDSYGILYSKDKTTLHYAPYVKHYSFSSYTVPSTVTSIGAYAFYRFDKLETLFLPEGLKKIGHYAFYICNKLIDCKLPSTVEVIGEYAFDGCNLSGLTLPTQLRSIGEYAFRAGILDKTIQALSIPRYVEKIESYAFDGIKIDSIYTHCKPFILSTYNPLGTPANQTLVVPKGTRDIFSTREGWKEINNVIEGDFEPTWNVSDYLVGSKELDYDGQKITQNGVTYALYNSGVAHVYCTIQSIYEYKPAAGENSLTIPESIYFRGQNYLVDGVENFAASKVIDLLLPNTVTFVKDVKSGVQTLKLPKSVTSVSGLYESKDLESFEVAEGNESFCVDSHSVLYSKDMTKLYYAPYGRYYSFSNYIVPSTVTSISEGAFYRFGELVTVSLPEGLKEIGNKAFNHCSKLIKCKLPSTVETIGEYAFQYCKLPDLTLPAQLRSIREYAFSYGIQKIQALSIPQYVEKIETYAFQGITIDSIYSHVMEPLPISDYAFNNQSSIKLVVPTGTIKEYKLMDGWNLITDITESDALLPTAAKCATPKFTRTNNTLTITSEPADAAIYYTMDGKQPTMNSMKYTAPITPTKNCTIKAIAMKDGVQNSEVSTYEVDWFKAEKPTFSLKENVLTITSETEGASIYYTVDGKTTPSATKGTLYTAPIELKGNCVVKAIAVKNGYEDSEVVTYEVDWFKVEEPAFSLNENILTITSETEGASIYYTVGAESVPSATRGTLYTAPVELKGNCVVKAIAVKDGYKDSEIVTYEIDWLNVEKPVFSLDGNTLTITSDTKGASIYYTVDGKTTPSATKGTLYTAPIELKGNCVVKAIAVKKGYEDSEVVTYEVDWFKVEKPIFSQNGNTLTITSETEGASIYYTLGAESVPSATNGTLYTAPIQLQDNRMVRAIAVKNGYDDSDIAEFVHGTVTCPTPAFEKYDGRYFTITPIGGAEIHYTTDGTTPTKASPLYDGRTAVTGLCTIKAIALSDVKNPSNVSSFAVTYFYSGEQALLTEAGTLEKAFEWCGTQDMEELSVNGPLNAADLTYIKEKLSTLQFLNLEDATIADHQLPTEAFAGMQLVSFTSPKDINNVGDRIFANCQHLAAIVWNASEKIPANSLGDNQNPNLLVYVSNKLLAPAGVRNVVANGTASTIVLADAESNNNFYCPIAFRADKISYTHNYSMKTEIGQCMGWETIALPFTVQKVTHESKGELTPYKQFEAEGSSEAARPFWLRALTSTGFEDVAEIEANTPYIISMPNSSAYAARYNVAGNVTFSAEKAEIPVTKMNAIEKGNVTFVPTFTSKAADRDIWLINKNMVYEGEQEGSVFVPNMREARPFEAYMTSQTIAHAPDSYL